MNTLARQLLATILVFGLAATGYAETGTGDATRSAHRTKAKSKSGSKSKTRKTAAHGKAVQNRVTLNFANAEIATVAKAMAEMTGRTIVVDPRVKGTLNLSTARPVAADTAYGIFLAALRMQGFASAEVNGVVRIVPEADAKFQGTTLTSRGQAGIPQGEVTTRIFVLRNKSASLILPVLRPLISTNNTISADTGSNTLLVTDYADNMARLEQVIASLDAAPEDEPVLIPLRYASAQEIAALVNRVFAPAGGQAAGAGDLEKFDVAVDTRSNTLIVRGRSRGIVAKVQTLVATLDVPTPMAGNVHVIYLKNAEAVKIAQTLRNILTGDASTATVSTGTTAGTAGNAQPTAQSIATAQAGSPGIVQADAASNALIITAPEAVFANIKAVVEKLDVRRAQVLVEALIAEVSADKAAQFGIQWMHVGSNGLIGGFGNSGTNNIGSLASNPLNAIGAATQGFNLGAGAGMKTLVEGTPATTAANGTTTTAIPAIQFYSLGVLATALQTDANANILSTPTLLTLDNEEAKISVGSNVPFQTGSYSIASGTSASPFTTIERKDVGLILKVKPQISEGGTVRLAISEEVSSIQGQGGILAATNKRSIDTTVLIDNGQIVVLGGLIEEQVQDTEDKVPLLGDIPLLGHLFRYSNRTHNKTNLMVFLRPTIIRDAADAAAATDPRYAYIVGVQKTSAPPQKLMLPDVTPPVLRDLKNNATEPSKAVDPHPDQASQPNPGKPDPQKLAPTDMWYQPVPAKP